jgi:hypothetical protein
MCRVRREEKEKRDSDAKLGSVSRLCPIKIRYLFCGLLVPRGNHIPNEFVKKAIQFISVLIGQNPGQWDHYGWKGYLKEKTKVHWKGAIINQSC